MVVRAWMTRSLWWIAGSSKRRKRASAGSRWSLRVMRLRFRMTWPPFLPGEIEPDRTLALARALMALDAGRWAKAPCPARTPEPRGAMPDEAWLAIRLALLPWPLPDERVINVDPAILRRLDCGDVPSAIELALRRLRAAGIAATVRTGMVAPDTARRWAAALAFPITQHTAATFVRRLDPNTMKEAHA